MVSKEKTEYLLKSCIGTKCEVMTETNLLLYVGLLTDYRKDVSQIQINIYRGDRMPQYIIHNTPVRVRVRIAEQRLLMIYGTVIGIGTEFYRVKVDAAIRIEEHRGYFRQRLNGRALVTLPNDASQQSECELADVSLNGIAFRSRTEYTEGSDLILSDVRINREEESHTFHCIVCRVSRDKETGQFVYGCSFLDLSRKDEDRLSRDIIRLQAEEIYRVSRQ